MTEMRGEGGVTLYFTQGLCPATCNHHTVTTPHTRKRIIFTNCDAFDFEYRFFVARASEYSVLAYLC